MEISETHTPAAGHWLSLFGLLRLIDRYLSPKTLAIALIVPVALCALLGMTSHFWLDEMVPFWTINGGFGQIGHRCTIFPQSVLYSLLVYSLHSLGLTQPWIFRLPSFFAMTGAVVILFHLARRLFSPSVAWLAVAIFVSLQPVQFAAADARPYGLATFAALLSTDLLLRLLDRPAYGLAIAYALATVLMVHLHMLFVTMVAVHGAYAGAAYLRGRRVPLSLLALISVIIGAGIAPLAVQYLAGFHDAKIHSFTSRPGMPEFLVTVFQAPVLVALLVAGSVLILKPHRGISSVGSPTYRVLPVLWTLTVPLLLFAISKFTEAQVFVPRYLLPGFAGLSLFLSVMISTFDPSRLISRLCMVALGVLALLPLKDAQAIRHNRYLGDWANAVDFVNRETAGDHAPVLVRSQFPESDYLPLEPVKDNPLFAPLDYYQATARFFPLGRNFRQQSARLDQFLAINLKSSRRFLFLFHGGMDSAQPFLFYLLGRLTPQWQMHIAGDFDGLTVVEFRQT